MKSWNKLIAVTFLMISASLPLTSFAQEQEDDTDAIHREITEGKLQAAEADMNNIPKLTKMVEEKQQTASNLVTQLNARVIDRYSANDESVKEENEYALIGFIAKLQAIHNEQENLERKEIAPDLKTLQEFNKRLDNLISDLKSFLK